MLVIVCFGHFQNIYIGANRPQCLTQTKKNTTTLLPLPINSDCISKAVYHNTNKLNMSSIISSLISQRFTLFV